jgi:hypothetical protein
MEFMIGVFLALAVSVFATVIGFDRDRAFYPTVTIVIASYYGLFAIMGGSHAALAAESVFIAGFVLVAVLGFKFNLWLLVAALVAHGGVRLFPRPPGGDSWRARMVADVLRGL